MKTSSLLVLSLSTLSLIGCAEGQADDGFDGRWTSGGQTGGSEDDDDPDEGDSSGESGTEGEDDDGEGDSSGESDGEETGGESGGETGGDSDGFVPDGEPQDCGGDTIVLDTKTPNVVLVLDKSGSMTSNEWSPDGSDDTETRWKSLHRVVENVVTDFEDRVNFGAALFPAYEAGGKSFDGACMMADAAEVQVAPNNAAAILAAIPGADDDTNGGTPATAGILNGLDALADIPETEPTAMVLVTDGVANCVSEDNKYDLYDEGLPQAVKDAYDNDGVATYVVGINITDSTDNSAGVNPREKLNEVAANGGVARGGDDKFYNVFDGAELSDAMDAIAARMGCTIDLPTPPSHPNYVEVKVGGVEIEQVEDCSSEDGWVFTSDTAPFNTIELCGSACTNLQVEGQLETDYACPPVG